MSWCKRTPFIAAKEQAPSACEKRDEKNEATEAKEGQQEGGDQAKRRKKKEVDEEEEVAVTISSATLRAFWTPKAQSSIGEHFFLPCL